MRIQVGLIVIFPHSVKFNPGNVMFHRVGMGFTMAHNDPHDVFSTSMPLINLHMGEMLLFPFIFSCFNKCFKIHFMAHGITPSPISFTIQTDFSGYTLLAVSAVIMPAGPPPIMITSLFIKDSPHFSSKINGSAINGIDLCFHHFSYFVPLVTREHYQGSCIYSFHP